MAHGQELRHHRAMDFRQNTRAYRTLLQLAGMASLLQAAACGHAAVEAKPAEPPKVVLEEAPPLVGSTGEMKPREAPRRVGDVWVHRFSGSYRGAPLLLREEVLALHANVLTIDYVLEDGDSTTHLRVEMTERTERILTVARIDGDESFPASISDYEEMLEKTLFVPEQNSGLIASKSQTCLVGKTELDCEINEYQVSIGDQEAKLSVARNDAMGRDVSGEVRAVDGTILYHAELLEMQRGNDREIATSEGLAMSEHELFDER